MLYNYKDKKKYIQHIELIAEDGTEYIGEFIDLRIKADTIPEGKFMYHCRHDDDGDWVTPVTIERKVVVNFCGTLIMDTEIDFKGETYIPIKDYSYM